MHQAASAPNPGDRRQLQRQQMAGRATLKPGLSRLALAASVPGPARPCVDAAVSEETRDTVQAPGAGQIRAWAESLLFWGFGRRSALSGRPQRLKQVRR